MGRTAGVDGDGWGNVAFRGDRRHGEQQVRGECLSYTGFTGRVVYVGLDPGYAFRIRYASTEMICLLRVNALPHEFAESFN